MKFLVSWHFSVKEKKIEIDFQDGDRGSHLGFLIGMIFANFDLQVAQILPIKFRVKWPLRLRKLKTFKQIFKMAAVTSILDFRSE